MLLDFDIIYLFLSLFLSIVGIALYRYGKRIEKYSWLVSGITLCVFPYFVTNVYAMLGIAGIAIAFPLFIEW